MTIPRFVRHEKDRLRWFGVVCLIVAGRALPGCLYDPDDRCDDGMVFSEELQLCICPVGSAFTPDGCVACGEHELPGATGCECEPGFTRPATGGACQEAPEIPAGLGEPCDPAAPACTSPFDHCEPAPAGGYCTSTGCASNDDCQGGYVCNTVSSACQKPPVGLGQACTTDADCAGNEATYCDAFVSHACQVQGCNPDADNCFAGFECCDLSAFAVPQPLCIPQGACMP
ncbi:MAG TPA: hypothetical protein VGK73_28065 [Polyangiaceae bacterium]